MKKRMFIVGALALFTLVGTSYSASAKDDYIFIDSSSSDFVTHYAPAPSGLIDPFIGTTIDVEDYMDNITYTHTDYDFEEEENVEYNLRAGVTYGLNKTFSLAFDPEKQKVRLEVGFLKLKSMENLRIRTRLSLRKIYLKAVYKW